MQNTYCLDFSLTVMIITGLWIPNSMVNVYWRFLYYLYSIVYHLIFYFPVLFMEMAHVFLVSDSVEAMAAASLLLLTHVSQLIKICVYWYRHERIRKLLIRIDDPIFVREASDKKKIIENTAKVTLNASKYFSSLVFTTGVFWGIYPILKPTLTLPLTYPYITEENPIFWYLYMYEIVGMTVIGIAVASMDFLVGGLMSIASSQLELLSYEISFIGKSDNYKEIRSPERSYTYLEYDYEYGAIVSCVKFHENIINLVKEMEGIFGMPIFFQFLLSSIIICETAFRVAVSTEVIELVTMVFYLMCVSTELLMFCYYGDVLKRKSELVLREAYCSYWQKTSVRTQKALLFLMMRAQRPVVLTAGNLFELSLMTYSTILKTSYSYFSVLNKKHNDS